MAFDRNSKIKDVWRHPVGRDMLRRLLVAPGRGMRWVKNPVFSNRTLASLERLGGPGFVDALVEIINAVPEERLALLPSAKQAWWKEAVAYRVYLPSFMDSDHDGLGDICGLMQRLPYLAKLGINLVWLCPFMDETITMEQGEEAGRMAADPACVEDIQALAEAAHAQGIRIIMDVNLTSTTESHRWFAKAKKGEAPFDGYYIFEKGEGDCPPNNWGSVPFGSAWKWYEEMESWGLCLNKAGMPDLNWQNARFRQEAASLLSFWLEKGMDGFCFPSVNTIAKNSMENGDETMAYVTGLYGFEKFIYGGNLHSYIRELRTSLDQEDELLLVGGVHGLGTGMAKLLAAGRQELDMVQDSSHLLPKTKQRSEEESLSLLDLKNYYTRWMEQYGNEGWMPLFLETANTPRMLSRLNVSPVYRGIVAKLLATMLLTLRGMPVIYQGQELGLCNIRFTSVDELRDAGALRMYQDLKGRVGEQAAFQKAMQTTVDHARVPMPWSAALHGGFSGAEPWMRVADGYEYLNAALQMEDSNSVWRHYQKLIKLRRRNPCLSYGSFNSVFAESRKVFCYFRIHENEKWYIELNLTEKEVVRSGRIIRTQKLVLSNYDTPSNTLRPYEANVYLCE